MSGPPPCRSCWAIIDVGKKDIYQQVAQALDEKHGRLPRWTSVLLLVQFFTIQVQSHL